MFERGGQGERPAFQILYHFVTYPDNGPSSQNPILGDRVLIVCNNRILNRESPIDLHNRQDIHRVILF